MFRILRQIFALRFGSGRNFALLQFVFYKECVHCGVDVHGLGSSTSMDYLLTASGTSYPLCADCIDSIDSVDNYCTHCGHVVRGISVSVGRCDLCRESSIGRGRRLQNHMDYTESSYHYGGALRSLLLRGKFQYYFSYRGMLESIVSLRHMDVSDVDIICHTPTHITRRLTRFRHPSVVVAQTLSRHTGIPVRPILRRGRMTKYQSRLVRTTRKSNVDGAFRVVQPVKGKTILLVDDILTTGATANECAKILKKHGASKVKLYTLAC